MKVYVLSGENYDTGFITVVGVFSTEENALLGMKIETRRGPGPEDSPQYYEDEMWIDVMELDNGL